MTAAFFLVFGISGVASASSSTYKVKSGDTLWKIAKDHKVTVKQIKTWNKLKSDKIKPKQVLKVKKTSTAKKKATVKKSSKKNYVTYTVKATAYTASCKGCSGITATGLNLKKNPGIKAISVDTKKIPLGTKVYVPGYGMAVAADKGGAIKGNKIDVFIPSKSKALKWGVKTVKIKVYK